MRHDTRSKITTTPTAAIALWAVILLSVLLLAGCEWLALGAPLSSADDAAIVGGPDDGGGGSGDSDDTEGSPDDSAETYTVIYDPNGADGGSVPADQTKTHGTDLTLAGNTGGLAKSGYNYAGWNTASDGSGTDYAEGATYSDDADLTLHAKWTTLPTYTVTYHPNGADGGSAPPDQTKTHGVDLTLATNTGGLTNTSHTLTGWNTQTDGDGSHCDLGGTYTTDAGDTLYAEWTINTYTVTFDGNGHDGGSVPSAITDDYNTSVSLPGAGTMTRTEATFVGWNTASDGSGTSYGAGASYTIGAAHVTLYAEWDINRYTVIYDANGFSGSVPVDSTQYEFGSSVTISDNTGGLAYTADGFNWLFDGWNTASDGSGIGYAPGETETMLSGGLYLYVQFTAIGATGQAGGYVFYDDQMLGAPVNLAGARYLEAAHESTEWSGKPWGGHGTAVGAGATGTAIGTGATNTAAIVAEYGAAEPDQGRSDYAAKICDDLVLGGYTDWFLPSRDELYEMYVNRDVIGGLYTAFYWSSSEDDSTAVWYIDPFSGTLSFWSKSSGLRVRAVRAF